MNLDTLDTRALAEAFTLYEARLFAGVNPEDLALRVNGLRAGQPRPTTAPHDTVQPVIQCTNQIAFWVAKEILKVEDVELRARALEKVIDCIELCCELSNHSTVMALFAALNTPTVRRLVATADLVPLAKRNRAKELGSLFSHQKMSVLDYSTTVTLPCIPFLGTILRANNAEQATHALTRLEAAIPEYQRIMSLDHSLVLRLEAVLTSVEPNEDLWPLSEKAEPRVNEGCGGL